MRIAHIIWALETGGAETMLVDIANEQVKTEQVAILVVNDMVNQSLADKVDNKCLFRIFGRKLGSKSLTPWIKLNAFLWKYSPDVIHFHLEGMRRMVFHPAPKVFTIHNTHTSGSEYPRYKALYAISDAVKIFTENQGYKAITIYNGIYSDKIKQRILPLQKCTRYKIVCVGRLYSPHKGQDLLIEAVANLKKRGVTGLQVDFIGDGESKKDLMRLVQEYGLDSEITFLGSKNRDYVYNHLCDYDLFVLPSRSEGFGLSVAEAVCAKIPVLVSNLKGPMEVIDYGKKGMVFNNGDAISLANKLFDFWKDGIDIDTIEEAFLYVKNNFDIRKTAKNYVEEYQKAIKQ